MPADKTNWQAPAVVVENFDATTAKLVARTRKLAVGVPEAAMLLDRLDNLPPAGAVVVVGETKKGKSSVVNALVGRPGLSPVAVDVATATYIAFGYGPDRVVVRPATGQPRLVNLSEIARWVSVDGLADNPDAHDANGVVPAFPVQVELSSDLLREVSILDTPGVGGLVGEHNQKTMDAIGRAGAMLFVTDVTSPLTKPEADFLSEVATSLQIPEVIIVANMSDKLTAGQLEEALADLHRNLDERLPTFAKFPVVAVSAVRAERAVTQTDLPDATRALLRESSRFDDLISVIRDRIVGRSQVLSNAHRLQVVHVIASAVAAQSRASLEAASNRTGPDVSPADLTAQLAALPDALDVISRQLPREITKLRHSLDLFLDQEMRTAGVEFDHAVTIDQSFDRLQAALSLRLDRINADLTALTSSGIAQVFPNNINALGIDDETISALELAMTTATAAAAAEIQLRGGSDRLHTPMAADSYAAAMMGATSGVGFMNSVLGGASGVGAAIAAVVGVSVGGLGLILGAATVAMNLHRGRRQARIGDNRSWLRDRLGSAQKDFADAFNASLEDATYMAGTALREFGKTRTAWLRQSIDVAKGTVTIDVKAVQTSLSDAEAVIKQAAELLGSAGYTPALPAGVP